MWSRLCLIMNDISVLDTLASRAKDTAADSQPNIRLESRLYILALYTILCCQGTQPHTRSSSALRSTSLDSSQVRGYLELREHFDRPSYRLLTCLATSSPCLPSQTFQKKSHTLSPTTTAQLRRIFSKQEKTQFMSRMCPSKPQRSIQTAPM